MPTIDRIAERSVVYMNAIAPGPQTYSSMPATFTGVHRDPAVIQDQPHEHYWEKRLAAISEHLDRFSPIPERLRELGYTTAGISPNPWTSKASGFDRGFDHFQDISGADRSRLKSLLDGVPKLGTKSKTIEIVIDGLTNQSFFSRWETFYDELLRLRDRLEEPYFLWVFVLDSHFPFVTSGAHRKETSLPTMYYASARSRQAMLSGDGPLPPHVQTLLERSYRDSVRAVDAFVQRFWDDFAADDPVVIFHSDHGESLGERGFYGHHDRLFEENIHVPYFVYDGQTERRVDEPISLSTIHDTVLDIARSGSFSPTAASSEFAFSRSEMWQSRTLRGSRWKLIDSEEEGQLLFDLDADGTESTNVAPEYPELVRICQDQLDRRERRVTEQSRISETVDALVNRAEI